MKTKILIISSIIAFGATAFGAPNSVTLKGKVQLEESQLETVVSLVKEKEKPDKVKYKGNIQLTSFDDVYTAKVEASLKKSDLQWKLNLETDHLDGGQWLELDANGVNSSLPVGTTLNLSAKLKERRCDWWDNGMGHPHLSCHTYTIATGSAQLVVTDSQ